ncbi:MAG TPA: MEDS domain-containing protein [Armatimonadota bacterium]|nr:MEDS domain-containing protein [Armatimonadota bacterium]
MPTELRKTGIEIIGDVPWGTHFCQFYQTKQDLLDILVPYIRNGLESNEFCMWVTADNLDECEAEEALRAVIPDLDRYVDRGALVILPYTEWYLDDGEFDRYKVLDSWVEKLNQTLAAGFDGARVTGDTMWLEKSHWKDFTEYEESINSVIAGQPLLVLCTYSLDKCGASEVADVVANHEFAMIKQSGEWTVIESSAIKQAKQALQAALDDLESRTKELEWLNSELNEANRKLEVKNEKLSTIEQELRSEIEERKQVEHELQRQKDLLVTVASNTETHLVYLDRDFNFIWMNPAYMKASGRTLEEFIGHNYFEFYPHEENQAIFERVRDTGIPFEAKEKPFIYPDHPEWGVTYWDWTLIPIKGSDGIVHGLVYSLVDVTHDVHARQEIEQLRADAESRAAELESVFSNLADGLAIFNDSGEVLLANKSARIILGAPDDVPLETLSRQYRLCMLDGKPLSVEEYSSRRALRGEALRDERFLLVSPWKEIVVSESASPIYDSSSRIIGATVIFRDQTERVAFEAQKQQILEREHRIAEVLQKALVPDTSYTIPGCEIAVRYEVALKEAEVGGDFYDVFDLGNRKIGILIGDVAGKGLAAAIQVAAARHSFRSYAYIESAPEQVMTLVNNAICRDPQQGFSMLTAFFAILDLDQGVMDYANAGHEVPVLRRADGTLEELDLEGIALGVIEGYDYRASQVILKPGDFVVMVTDGIIEARPDSKHLFGLEGMVSFLSKKVSQSADELAEGLLAAAKKHAGGALSDDAALMVFGLENEKSA